MARDPDGGADAPRAEAPAPRRRRHPVRWVVLGLLGVAFLGVLLGGVTLARMRGDLSAGKAALLDGRRDLLAGRTHEAAARFEAASARFADGHDVGDGALAAVAGWMPGFGNNVRTADALAVAGTHLADAGDDLASAIAALPGGIDALAPSKGRLPLPTYLGLADAMDTAADEAAASLASLDSAPDAFLLPQVRDARWDAIDRAEDLVRSLEAGRRLLRGLPAFAGATEPTRYLVIAQNPAEIRGTGGIWGAYAILTLRGGRTSLSAAAPTQALADVTQEQITGVSDDYVDNYARYGGAASWQNMNITPDFPSAAAAALANYQAGQGERLDGVIAADPFALASMLRVTGPVPVPGTDVRVSADDVVAFTTNGAYTNFPRQAERKVILGAVSADVIGRFLALDGKGLPRLRALATAVGGGHLLVYSTDPTFEAGLRSAGAAGAFLADASAAPADVASITVANGSANKVDFYANRSVSYDVVLAPDGAVEATLDVRIVNHAPTEGAPRYVLGPFVKGLGPGDARPDLNGWCHDPCTLDSADRDGQEIAVEAGTEGGLPWYRNYEQPIPAGQTGRLTLAWRTDDVWEGNTSSGTYRLLFLGQTTIRPTTLRVRVTAPPGTEVVWSNVPVSTEGNVATYTGIAGPRTEIVVRFQAPVALRWFRNADRALD